MRGAIIYERVICVRMFECVSVYVLPPYITHAFLRTKNRTRARTPERVGRTRSRLPCVCEQTRTEKQRKNVSSASAREHRLAQACVLHKFTCAYSHKNTHVTRELERKACDYSTSIFTSFGNAFNSLSTVKHSRERVNER